MELWITGVRTYDAFTATEFNLRATVIWCIHDYPALSTLYGRTTRGYYACIHCDKDPMSRSLRQKLCYIGHRRYLPMDDPLRKNKRAFDGNSETREKPRNFSREELLQELDMVQHVRPGKHEKKKRKRGEQPDVRSKVFSRKSLLYSLPYWIDLVHPYNLDVMHIEKNICMNLLGTLLDIQGKTKDTVNARLDLEDMGIRLELHLLEKGNEKYSMSPACYRLKKDDWIMFCEFIREIWFPDGFASNLARCITSDGASLQDMETHDCHIILQRLLAVGLRGLVTKDIYVAIAELGRFFRELCSRKLNIAAIHRLKDQISRILCNLEKKIPPAFFDVMVHLAVHLPDEALLRGPV